MGLILVFSCLLRLDFIQKKIGKVFVYHSNNFDQCELKKKKTYFTAKFVTVVRPFSEAFQDY